MRVYQDNSRYVATHVPGPTQNFLALELEDAPVVTDFSIVENERPNEQRLVSAEAVRASVIEGVARANAELGTGYAVKRAEFVAGDTNYPLIYIHLAYAIVLFAHTGDWRDSTA